ncbi:Uncharacterised protein [uncultured archaeon]|nr:Uncharacterised protein [uncultured archaeon]
MRRLISKAEEEKKKRRNQILVGVVLIFVMFFSVIGYSLGNFQTSGTSIVNYNGFKFTQESNLWKVNVGSFQFSFRYNPNQVEKISSTLNLLNSYQDKPLYFSSENSEAASEIYNNLFVQNKIVQRAQSACLSGEKCSGNYPIKTCDDNFIIIKESNSSNVRQDKNCVFIEGKTENLVGLSDSFLFKITGIQ